VKVVLMNTKDQSVVARFDADAPPRVGDRMEILPHGRAHNWRNWEVQAVRWTLDLEEPDADTPRETATFLHVVADVAEVSRTD
jgi:hypothetical protein